MDVTTWADVIKADDQAILDWADAQPWASDMAKCLQDNQWHAEGDVWTHTKMVCDQLPQLEHWASLDRGDQIKLLFAALLHDSGKPGTTAPDPNTGRLRSPKHSLAGAALARDVLRKLHCDLSAREEIVSLVRYHGRPPHVEESTQPIRDVVQLSWLASNRLFYLLALADTMGRRTTVTNRPVEAIELWRELAEEQQCFTTPFAFGNDRARVMFFRRELGDLHYCPHEDYRCTVTMMSGLPGAGKDYWLSRRRPDLPVVSLDAVRRDLNIAPTDNQGRVAQKAREQCRDFLRRRRDFAFSATNVSRFVRRGWLDVFLDYGARIELVYLEPPLPMILSHNRTRSSQVPEKVILRLANRLDPPNITECHRFSMF